MQLLVYCPVPVGDVQRSLGLPEYSYVFVAERFRPALERLGEVVTILDPAEIPGHVTAAAASGDECVLISFAPPSRSPLGLPVRTLSVFAWEFETIPTEVWGDDPQQDWRTALADHGTAVCLSRHTRRAVLAAMGDDYPVYAVPAPIFHRFAESETGRTEPELDHRSFTFHGLTISAADFDEGDTTVLPHSPLARHHEGTWSGSLRRLVFTDTSADRGSLVGFYRPEPWGAWSRTDTPWLLLPMPLTGRVLVRLNAVGYGPNAGRVVTARVGRSHQEFRLTGEAASHDLVFQLAPDEVANTIEFSGLTVSRLPDSLDVRSMAIGLCWLEVEQITGVRRFLPRPLRRVLAGARPTPGAHVSVEFSEVEVSGVVYTSVLNPDDGRKNWEDLVTAFCHAFRHQSGATLLLKMTHRSLAAYLSRLQFLLHRIGPVKCRVVAIHGFLTDDELRHLIRISTFYVNSSEAEGLCMPLMEFLSAGVPAISPDHTAMADYVDPSSCFVVASAPFPTIWPQDPRQLWKAHKYRVHWDSLVAAFEDSYRVAMDNPSRYAALSRAAVARQRQFSGDEAVVGALAEVLFGPGAFDPAEDIR